MCFIIIKLGKDSRGSCLSGKGVVNYLSLELSLPMICSMSKNGPINTWYLFRYIFKGDIFVTYFFSAHYEGVSINNQPISFPMDQDGHDFNSLFQYMFYSWVQNCTRIESFFNKILNVKHG